MENTRGSNSREVSYERFAIIQEKLKWNIYWREKYPTLSDYSDQVAN